MIRWKSAGQGEERGFVSDGDDDIGHSVPWTATVSSYSGRTRNKKGMVYLFSVAGFSKTGRYDAIMGDLFSGAVCVPVVKNKNKKKPQNPGVRGTKVPNRNVRSSRVWCRAGPGNRWYPATQTR